MRKREIPEIMRPQYKAFQSDDGVEYEVRTISIFEVIHICDYYYKDFQRSEKKNLPKVISDGLYMPVFFHHNDYWIIDGFDLARVITNMSLIHRCDWRKVVNGKWRLQPDWLLEWRKRQNDSDGEKKTDEKQG